MKREHEQVPRHICQRPFHVCTRDFVKDFNVEHPGKKKNRKGKQSGGKESMRAGIILLDVVPDDFPMT